MRVTVLAGATLWLVLAATTGFAVEIIEHPEVLPFVPFQVIVIWDTDVPRDSLVESGVDENYIHSSYDPAPTTIHEMSVPVFEFEVLYDFRVTSSEGGPTEPAVDYAWHDNSENFADVMFPTADEIVSGEVWLTATTTHPAIEVTYASFEVIPDDTGVPVFIGEDLDGADAVYNTFQPATTGDGWSAYWDSTMFPEGGYTVVATLDTWAGPFSATQHVLLDHTPPTPSLDWPDFGDRAYGVVFLQANGANDSFQCAFSKKKAKSIISFPTTSFVQTDYDFRGRPGSMMCHPTAQAMILWTNPKVRNKYTNDKRNKNKTEAFAKTLLVWDLARCKGTNSTGTNYGNARTGSRKVTKYVRGTQSGFDWSYTTWTGRTKIKKLKQKATQPKGRVKGVGLHLHRNSNPNATGHVVVLKKIDDNAKTDKNGRKYYDITITDPATGQDQTVQADANGNFTYNGQSVFIKGGFRFTGSDAAGSDSAPAGEDDWVLIGIDDNPLDGWSMDWDTGPEEPGLYYLKATTTQPDGMSGDDTTEVAVPAVGSMSDAKLQPDGMPVDVVGYFAVTHVAEDGFWVEAVDRSSGIRSTRTDVPISRDAIVEIKGSMTTQGFERMIEAVEVTVLQAFAPVSIPPLGMPNRSVAGGDLEYDPSVGSGQMGAPGAYGLNNVGMLVRTFGRYVGPVLTPTGWYHIIDDGSAIGILLSTEVMSYGDYVFATGICGLEESDDGSILPVVRARDADDVQVITLQ